MRRNVLKDRSGKISGAIAALLAIIVILIYMRAAGTPKGSEDAFYTVYGALKWFLKALDLEKYVEEYLKEFEEFLKYVQGTELWPLTISILALVVMELAIMGIYCGTWITIDTTTSILGWVSGLRARRRRDEKYFEFNKKSGINLGISRIIAAVGKRKGSRPKIKAKGIPSGTPDPKKGNGAVASKSPGTIGGFYKRWWQIRKESTLTLEEGKISWYILEAKKKFPTDRSPDGSLIELSKAAGIDASTLQRTLNEGRNSITVKNLIRLLYMAGIPYDDATPYIKSIGGRGDKEAVVNPKFPIDLNKPEAGILFAAALKDGDINVAHHHFEYVNFDSEKRRTVAEAVKEVFGDVEPVPLYDRDGRVKGIHFQTSLIGDTLVDFGAVAGRKASQDYHMPPPIWFGNLEIKNAYFDQVIKDEGSIDRGDYRLIISGAGEIASKITQAHSRLLDKLDFEDDYWPSGAPKRFLIISEELEKRIPLELRKVYKDLVTKLEDEWVPMILNEEKDLIEKTYGVKAEIQLRQIYIGEKVGLRGSWVIIVSGKGDVVKIKNEINSFRDKWSDKKR